MIIGQQPVELVGGRQGEGSARIIRDMKFLIVALLALFTVGCSDINSEGSSCPTAANGEVGIGAGADTTPENAKIVFCVYLSANVCPRSDVLYRDNTTDSGTCDGTACCVYECANIPEC